MAIASPKAEPKPRLWTRDEFERAGELGLFGPDERLELLDGEILCKMSPQSEPHAAAIEMLGERLRDCFGDGYRVREEKPVVLSEISEPEPDICVVRRSAGGRRRHPRPGDMLLAVEVSDSSISHDRSRKASAYARAGIPEYWIENVRDRVLEVRTDPGPVGPDKFDYRSIRLVTADGCVSPAAAPDCSIAFKDIFPAAPPDDLEAE